MEKIKRHYLDLVALAVNSSRKAYSLAEGSMPILKGGYALSGIHFSDYPRITNDLDFESNNFYPEDDFDKKFFEDKIINGAEEIIRGFFIGRYGRDILKTLKISTDTKLSAQGTLKSKINIKGVESKNPISIKIETAEQESTTNVENKRIKNHEAFGSFGDDTILTATLSNIFLNKMMAFLDRAAFGFDSAEFFSRTKDLFDIDYILEKKPHMIHMPKGEIKAMLEKEKHRIGAVKKYFNFCSNEFFSLYFENMKKHLKNGEQKTDQELFRRMTLGFDFGKESEFPKVDTVLSNFKKASALLGKEFGI